MSGRWGWCLFVSQRASMWFPRERSICFQPSSCPGSVVRARERERERMKEREGERERERERELELYIRKVISKRQPSGNPPSRHLPHDICLTGPLFRRQFRTCPLLLRSPLLHPRQLVSLLPHLRLLHMPMPRRLLLPCLHPPLLPLPPSLARHPPRHPVCFYLVLPLLASHA